MNKVILFGKAGADAEEKKEGFVVFRLATTEARKTKEGNWEKQTEWHAVVCGSYTAEKAKNIKKGDDVLVEGQIRTHEYNNQRYTQIDAKSVTVVGAKPQAEKKSNDMFDIPF